jgi:hypothetical protein
LEAGNHDGLRYCYFGRRGVATDEVSEIEQSRRVLAVQRRAVALLAVEYGLTQWCPVPDGSCRDRANMVNGLGGRRVEQLSETAVDSGLSTSPHHHAVTGRVG